MNTPGMRSSRLVALAIASIALLPGPARSDAAAARQTWLGALIAHIGKFKRYPAGPQALAERPAGTVIINFTIDANGNVIDHHVARSSCIDLLDKEALATIRRASPFPPSPPELRKERQEFSVPIQYRTVWGDLPLPRTDCLTS